MPVFQHGNRAHALVCPGFGARLKRARIAAGFDSQPKLARACGLSVNTVCQHEIERTPPSMQAIVAYCRVLNIPASQLQYGLGDPSFPPAVAHYLCSHLGLNLHPETRARLAAMPWAVVADGQDTTEPQVHAIARVVDRFVRAREHHPDAGGLPGGDAPVSDGPGAGHAPRCSGAAASA